MPKPTLVSKLPDELKEELNSKIRANGYSEYEEISNWLHSQGIKASRSAVHRHGQRLRELDRASRVISDAACGNNVEKGEAIDLMMELASLRIREHRIMRRLEEIGAA